MRRALTDERAGRYPNRVRNSGKANPIAVLVILAVAAFLYVAVIAGPAVTDNMDVQEAIDMAVNNSQRDDDYLRRFIEEKLMYVGEHKEDDGYGNLQVVKGLGFTDDDIQIERNDVDNTITIGIDYTRDLQLKPTKSIWTLHFHPTKTGPIKQ